MLPRLVVLADELVRVGCGRLTVGVGSHAREEPGAARGETLDRPRHDRDVDRVQVGDFVQMAEEGVGQEDDRGSALFRRVEGVDRVLVALGHGGRIEDDARVVAGRAIASLVEVALSRHRRHAGPGPDAHNVHDHARDADLVAVADGLLHQAEARAGGGGEGFGAGQARAQDRVGAGDLVFGLQEAKLGMRRRIHGGLREDLG